MGRQDVRGNLEASWTEGLNLMANPIRLSRLTQTFFEDLEQEMPIYDESFLELIYCLVARGLWL